MTWKNKTKMATIMEMKQILPPIPAPRASQQPLGVPQTQSTLDRP